MKWTSVREEEREGRGGEGRGGGQGRVGKDKWVAGIVTYAEKEGKRAELQGMQLQAVAAPLMMFAQQMHEQTLNIRKQSTSTGG